MFAGKTSRKDLTQHRATSHIIWHVARCLSNVLNNLLLSFARYQPLSSIQPRNRRRNSPSVLKGKIPYQDHFFNIKGAAIWLQKALEPALGIGTAHRPIPGQMILSAAGAYDPIRTCRASPSGNAACRASAQHIFRALSKLKNYGMSSAAGLLKSVLGLILVVTTNTIVRKIDADKALY